mgnify:CR=1 FL=1
MKPRSNVWLWGGGLLGLLLVIGFIGASLVGMFTGGSGNPGLTLQVSVTKGTFDLKEPIDVKITLLNQTGQPLRVLKLFLLEDYPVRFDILDEQGKKVRFVGPELKLKISEQDFVTLQPGQVLEKVINLRFDVERGVPLYDLSMPGRYRVTAVYSPLFRLPEVQSNTIEIVLRGS